MAVAQAKILWDGLDGPVNDLEIGTGVVLSNDDLGGESVKQWYLVQRPSGSSAALTAGPTSGERTLTPDVYGTYVVRLIVNNALMHVSAGAVLYPSGLRQPAVGETTAWDATEGWAGAASDLWRAAGMGVPLLGLTSKSSTGALTKEEVVGKIVRAVTSGGAVALDLPDLNDTIYHMASGVVVRVGGSNVTLNAPAGASLRAAGAIGSSYVMADDAEVVRWHYDAINNVFYMAVSKAGGGGGEVNTASNVGSSAEVFKQKTGVDLEFRTFHRGRGTAEVEQLADTMEIRAGLQYAAAYSSNALLDEIDVINTFLMGDTSGGAVDLTLPEATQDFFEFAVVREGGDQLRLLSPDIAYRIVYPGYVDDQTYEMNTNGDTAHFVYVHAVQTYYVIG